LPGAQCEYWGGSNWFCCGYEYWQFCDASCQWNPCQYAGFICY
jgi:hypothetical protein